MADMYRAMAKFVGPAGAYTVVLDGLRHDLAWAQRDIAKAEGYDEAWIEEANWTRVDASTRKDES